VVAHERHGAALADAPDDVLGIRSAADHVAERPQLVGAGGVGRGEHRVERLRMRVHVGQHRHHHR
jgi:hypothetical protein